MIDNGTFFEASNGWQFRVNEHGHMQAKFREFETWDHMPKQLTLGLIEWAQSEIWTGEES